MKLTDTLESRLAKTNNQNEMKLLLLFNKTLKNMLFEFDELSFIFAS